MTLHTIKIYVGELDFETFSYNCIWSHVEHDITLVAEKQCSLFQWCLLWWVIILVLCFSCVYKEGLQAHCGNVTKFISFYSRCKWLEG